MRTNSMHQWFSNCDTFTAGGTLNCAQFQYGTQALMRLFCDCLNSNIRNTLGGI